MSKEFDEFMDGVKNNHSVDTNEMVEISDKEIEKAIWEHFSDKYDNMWSERIAFRLGVKWYKEQIKKK